MKLSKLKVPAPIVDFILDFKPLLEQAIQVVRQKYEFVCQLEMRVTILHEHQSLIYESHLQVVELEAKANAKNKMETLKAYILSWNQLIN